MDHKYYNRLSFAGIGNKIIKYFGVFGKTKSNFFFQKSNTIFFIFLRKFFLDRNWKISIR